MSKFKRMLRMAPVLLGSALIVSSVMAEAQRGSDAGSGRSGASRGNGGAARVSSPSRPQGSAPRISQPSTPRVSAPRVSQPSAPRVSAPARVTRPSTPQVVTQSEPRVSRPSAPPWFGIAHPLRRLPAVGSRGDTAFPFRRIWRTYRDAPFTPARRCRQCRASGAGQWDATFGGWSGGTALAARGRRSFWRRDQSPADFRARPYAGFPFPQARGSEPHSRQQAW
jgi:hypothetical protein